MVKQLSSIEEVILALGGPQAVAQLTKRKSVSAVPMWKNRGVFPANTFALMQTELKARNAKAPYSLWNMMEASDA